MSYVERLILLINRLLRSSLPLRHCVNQFWCLFRQEYDVEGARWTIPFVSFAVVYDRVLKALFHDYSENRHLITKVFYVHNFLLTCFSLIYNLLEFRCSRLSKHINDTYLCTGHFARICILFAGPEKIGSRSLCLRLVWYRRCLVWLEEGGVVLWREWCSILNMAMWYFE